MSSVDPKLLGRIRGYCQRSWFNSSIPTDLYDDCTQDVFCRISETIPLDRWNLCLVSGTEEHAEFMRAVDAVGHKTRRRLSGGKNRIQYERLYDTPCENDPQTIAEENETTSLILLCVNDLSDRRRSVLLLFLKGYDAAEISRRTGMQTVRIHDERYKAVRQLREDERLNAIR